MNAEKYFVWLLSTNAGVSALATGGVFSEVAPQRAQPDPFIVLEQVSREDDMALDGVTGTRRVMIEVSCWSTKRGTSNTLARAVFDALADHSGGAEGLDVQSISPGSESWDFDPDTKLYATSREWEVWVSGAED